MKILWYADFEGGAKEQQELDAIFDDLVEELGGSYEGPFYPQQASLLYIFDCPEYEWLNRSGRRWFKRVNAAGLEVVPQSYEIAVTPDEFWGPEGRPS